MQLHTAPGGQLHMLVNSSVDPAAAPPLTPRYQEKATSEHLRYLLNERNYQWLLTRGSLTDVISTFILSSRFSSLFNCSQCLWNVAAPSRKEESEPSCEPLIVVLELKPASRYCCVCVCVFVCVCMCVCVFSGWRMGGAARHAFSTAGGNWNKTRAD